MTLTAEQWIAEQERVRAELQAAVVSLENAYGLDIYVASVTEPYERYAYYEIEGPDFGDFNSFTGTFEDLVPYVAKLAHG